MALEKSDVWVIALGTAIGIASSKAIDIMLKKKLEKEIEDLDGVEIDEDGNVVVDGDKLIE